MSSRTLGLGPYGDPVEPQLTTLYGFDDAGRPVAADWYRGDLQEDVPLGQHLQVFGKDDRVLASMRGWAEPGGTLLSGQFRAASYNGRGWVQGLKTANPVDDPSAMASYAQFVDDVATTPQLRAEMQSSVGDLVDATSGLPGDLRTYTRTDLGALQTETDEAMGVVWSATGVTDTSTPTFVGSAAGGGFATWDDRGRLLEVDGEGTRS